MPREEHMWITGVVSALSALAMGPETWDLDRVATYRHHPPVPAAQIWFDRGVDPVLQRGDRVRVLLSLDRDRLCGHPPG